jgi:spermidine synthase
VSTHRFKFFIFLAFLFSGAAGLLYQSIWTKYLGYYLGHDAYAQSIVLIIFMGGLTIGSFLAGKWMPLLRNPGIFYVILEIFIAAYALVFPILFDFLTNFSYEKLFPAIAELEKFSQQSITEKNTSAIGIPSINALSAEINLFLSANALLLLILPTIALGMTFPAGAAMVTRLSDNFNKSGGAVSHLYFINSLGASVGVLLGVFIFVPLLGLNNALAIGGVFSAIAAAIVLTIWLWFKQKAETAAFENFQSVAPDTKNPKTITIPKQVYFFIIISAATGFASFIYEIAWVRLLTQVFGASLHSFEIMLATFILGLAIGSIWIKSFVSTDKKYNLLKILIIVQVLMGSLAIFSGYLYHFSFSQMGFLVTYSEKSLLGYAFYVLGIHFIAFLIMFPVTFLAGMTLPLLTQLSRIAMTEKNTETPLKSNDAEGVVGYIYAANTLGAIFAVLLAVHWGLPQLGATATLKLGAWLDIAIGWLIASMVFFFILKKITIFDKKIKAIGYFSFILILTLSAFLLSQSLVIEKNLLASGIFRYGSRSGFTSQVEYYQDGKTAAVSILEIGDNRKAILTNGKPDAGLFVNKTLDQETLKYPTTSDEVTMVLLGALGGMYHQNPEKVAVIGFGSGLSSHVVLEDKRVTHLDTIEIEPKMAEASKHFLPRNENVYQDRRSSIIFQDARAYLAKNKNEKYDLIISEPSNPWVKGVGALFTKEFYLLAKSRLKNNGLLVQWLHIYEMHDQTLLSTLAVLDEVFSDYHLYLANNGDIIIVASADKTNLTLPDFSNYKIFSKELEKINFSDQKAILSRWVADKKILGAYFQQAALHKRNTDDYPYLELHAPIDFFLKSKVNLFKAIVHNPLPVLFLLADEKNALTATDRFSLADMDDENLFYQEKFTNAQKVFEKLKYPEKDIRIEKNILPNFQALFTDCKNWNSYQEGDLQQLAHYTLTFMEKEAKETIWSDLYEQHKDCKNPIIRIKIELFQAMSQKEILFSEKWMANILFLLENDQSYTSSWKDVFLMIWYNKLYLYGKEQARSDDFYKLLSQIGFLNKNDFIQQILLFKILDLYKQKTSLTLP